MSGDKALSWAYTEEYLPEPEAAARARASAEEFAIRPVSRGTGATLAALAAAIGAHSVAEIGTGTGTSAAWLCSGMSRDGVLTSIDIEPESQTVAREILTSMGVKPANARLIFGRALSVLPRLADGAYDLVFIDGDPEETEDYLTHAVRMLRPGGTLAVNAALWNDRVPEPARRDPDTVRMRELVRRIRDDENLTSTLLPCGDGLLVAVKTTPRA
ncbi:MAG: O-methyltransferase [Bowdeniella nasicola]|nr:O-methyltransferase [Bowdeniella nasicola]